MTIKEAISAMEDEDYTPDTLATALAALRIVNGVAKGCFNCVIISDCKSCKCNGGKMSNWNGGGLV